MNDLSQPGAVHWNLRLWHLRCQSSLHLLMNCLFGQIWHLNFNFCLSWFELALAGTASEDYGASLDISTP